MGQNKLSYLVDKGLSENELANTLGVARGTVRYYLRKFGLQTKTPRGNHYGHRCLTCGRVLTARGKRNNKYCSIKCSNDGKYQRYIALWLAGKVSGNTGSNSSDISGYVRRWVLERAGHQCEICGWRETNVTTGKSPLAIHHTDGNSRHSRPENLQALCPNHHSLTPSYGSLNRGKGRNYPRKNLRVLK